MKKALSFTQFKFDVWLIEQLLYANSPGLTLMQLQERWKSMPNHTSSLTRDTLTNHRKTIKEFLGVCIEAPDRLHYRIVNPGILALDSLANDLLKSLQNYVFLQEYKDLGDKIQPEKIDTGSQYLSLIGQAMRDMKKLKITYQKFVDNEAKVSIIHPYCLKACKGRWYILAYKEENEHNIPAQVFALDRTLALSITTDDFIDNPDIDPSTYFSDCFGIYKDFERFPVKDITIAVKPYVANYIRTQPLHHSQREQTFASPDAIYFSYHLSPSYDFLKEIASWRGDAWIVE